MHMGPSMAQEKVNFRAFLCLSLPHHQVCVTLTQLGLKQPRRWPPPQSRLGVLGVPFNLPNSKGGERCLTALLLFSLSPYSPSHNLWSQKRR